jgi:hypothetical protein
MEALNKSILDFSARVPALREAPNTSAFPYALIRPADMPEPVETAPG